MTPITGFDIVSKQYFEELAKCTHPIYDPSELYEQLEMNQTSSKVTVPTLYLPGDDDYDPSDPTRSWKKKVGTTYAKDYHFKACEKNYDLLTEMVTAAVFNTQLLGNLIDIAATETAPGQDDPKFANINGHVAANSPWMKSYNLGARLSTTEI